MSARMALNLLRVTVFFLILLPLLAQTPAPPEVDQALRARVTEFLQYHVDGNFRKAYDMVAEDTKDNYFNSGKVQLTEFKIDDVKYSDNFTRASVSAKMGRVVNVAGQDFPVVMPSTTTWKVENGKWVWYNEVKPGLDSSAITLPGITPASPAVTPNQNAEAALPKDFNDQTIASAARSILQQVGVDKREVTMAADKASEERVVFHNGMPGSVQLELTAPEIPGFTAKIAQPVVRAAGDVTLVLRYEPDARTERKDPASVVLTVQPLNQTFVIRVNFAAPGPTAAK